MSESLFEVKSHQVPACHIREYAGSTSDNQEDVLWLDVKQYVPRQGETSVQTCAITLIATHAAAMPKELYEPLWDELLHLSKSMSFKIRGIWTVDNVNSGASGVMNENKLSSDYSWMDHARDLLLVTNYFREAMPRPIIGIGHSFGGCQMANLALLHPRLLTSLILMDPVIQLDPPNMGLEREPLGLINHTIYKQDVFSSRSAASEAIRRHYVFKSFDPRVIDLMVKHGFRNLPTALHTLLPSNSDPSDPPVTYTSTIHQDAWTQLRENFKARKSSGRIELDRSTHADIDPLAAFVPFYRPEPRSTWYRLPALRPSTLWLVGEKSYLSLDQMREGVKRTGTGIGGSGGIQECRVREDIVPNHGHLFPFEIPRVTAHKCACWLEAEMERFGKQEQDWTLEKSTRSRLDDLRVNDQWKSRIRNPKNVSKNDRPGLASQAINGQKL